jgi:hypothetical protein
MKKIMTGLTVIVDTAEMLATYTQQLPVMVGFFDSVESPGGAPTPREHFLLVLLLRRVTAALHETERAH